MTDFASALKDANERVQARLGEALSPNADLPVERAMHYAATGGKGLRGFFAMESARLHDIPPETAVHAAAAIEAMHAYSLVHDDLPCMDDDDLRRGRPTVHIKWDEATAVLAGDGLQALAFELLGHVEPRDRAMILVRNLAQSAGVAGMVGGQAMDIAAETAVVPLNTMQIAEIHARKTGALIGWSCSVGPVLADGNATAMWQYSTAVGLAFQIADDILDVTGDEPTTGKRVGKDEAAGKATFVSAVGLDGARRMLDKYLAQANDALSVYGARGDLLRKAARFVIARRS